MSTVPAWMLKSKEHAGLVKKVEAKAKRGSERRQVTEDEEKASNEAKAKQRKAATPYDAVSIVVEKKKVPRSKAAAKVDPILAYMRQYYDSYKAPQARQKHRRACSNN